MQFIEESSSAVESFRAGESRRQGLVTLLLLLRAELTRMLVSSQFAFSKLYGSGSPAQEMIPPTVKMDLPRSINKLRIITHSCAQKALSLVSLSS